MTLAIMQPYLFPYLGYFMLARVSDVFVVYGEAQYRRGGYVNRNRLLVNGKPRWFTAPVHRGSLGDSIDERLLRGDDYATWREGLLKTLRQAYARSPRVDAAVALVQHVTDSSPASVGELAARSVVATLDYLGVRAEIVHSRDVAYDRDSSGPGKVLDMCRALGAERYVNAPGGRELYDAEAFAAEGVRLTFLQPELREYPQTSTAGATFVSGLSVLDAVANLPPDRVRSLLDAYTLDDAH